MLLGMKMMGMKTHRLSSGFGIYYFFFSSGPWQVSVTHTEHWISQGTSRQGFVFKSILQALGTVAIGAVLEPLFFGAIFPICLMIGLSCIQASLAELLCSLEPEFGAIYPSQLGRSLI